MMMGSEKATTKRPTLAEHLSRSRLEGSARKTLFGRYKVPRWHLIELGAWIFGMGAVYGRARREKLELVAELFIGLKAIGETFSRAGFPRHVADDGRYVLEALRKIASDGLRHYRDSLGKDPESLNDLLLTSFSPRELDYRNPEILLRLRHERVGISTALQQLDAWLFAGISLGAFFPDLTERMWKNSYEQVDHKVWELAYKSGLEIPKEFTPLPLDEIEKDVLLDVATYIAEYFPELARTA